MCVCVCVSGAGEGVSVAATNNIRVTSFPDLRRVGVEEVDELEARVLDGERGAPDDQVQRALGLLQQGVQPQLHVALRQHRPLQLHRLALPGRHRHDAVVDL